MKLPLSVRIRNKITPAQIIILGFLLTILIGTLLLKLPISHNGPQKISFLDALFTSTSAVCVTGLIVKDTATTWSGFGQGVILFFNICHYYKKKNKSKRTINHARNN